jgi:cyanophycin synthetase
MLNLHTACQEMLQKRLWICYFQKAPTGEFPFIAITGQTEKLLQPGLQHTWQKLQGKHVGYTTSDGVYIHNQLMMKGDCTGPQSAQFVLKDPTVDFAVLECARGGILRAGLGFTNCDVGIVTNVAADHMGLGGIHTLEQMATVKSIVPETVFKKGFAVLNADDDLVYGMSESLECNIALFSMDENNARIRSIVTRAGWPVYMKTGMYLY